MIVSLGFINLVGLLCDGVGFAVLGYHLLRAPDRRPFWSGGGQRFDRQFYGFLLVVSGFAIQAFVQFMRL